MIPDNFEYWGVISIRQSKRASSFSSEYFTCRPLIKTVSLSKISRFSFRLLAALTSVRAFQQFPSLISTKTSRRSASILLTDNSMALVSTYLSLVRRPLIRYRHDSAPCSANKAASKSFSLEQTENRLKYAMQLRWLSSRANLISYLAREELPILRWMRALLLNAIELRGFVSMYWLMALRALSYLASQKRTVAIRYLLSVCMFMTQRKYSKLQNFQIKINSFQLFIKSQPISGCQNKPNSYQYDG